MAEVGIGEAEEGTDVESAVGTDFADKRTNHSATFPVAFDDVLANKLLLLPVFALEHVPDTVVFVGEEFSPVLIAVYAIVQWPNRFLILPRFCIRTLP